MKHHFLTLLFISLSFMVYSQSFTISGYVTDQQTGEKLIGANVYAPQIKAGEQTNNYGFFSLSLPAKDTVEIVVSFIGYATQTQTVFLTQNQSINIELQSGILIENVTVSANSIDRRNEMGNLEIPMKQFALIPAIGSEADPIKAFQLMPGVQSGNEGSSGLHVRGGSPDQNLVLLDDVPLYYVNHLGGFVSIFNIDAINSISLIKGSFPARYGGRLSSVLDVRMKDGNMKKMSGNFSISSVTSKIYIDSPVQKDKSSIMFSARGFLWGVLYQPLMRILLEDMSVGYNFYDINLKYNHKIDKNNRLYFSFYNGDDNLLFNISDQIVGSTEKGKNALRWGNFMLATRWNKIYSPKLFSNLTLAYTRYRYVSDFSYTNKIPNENEYLNYNYKAGINDFSLKYEFDYFANNFYKLKTGTDFTIHRFNPGATNFVYKINDTIKSSENVENKQLSALENTYYLENSLKAGKRFETNLGLRASFYFVENKNFVSLEPRVLSRLAINKSLAVKASYTRTSQNVHLLTSSTASMPVDIWMPATQVAKPSQANQFALGVFKNFSDKKIELSIESYYKKMTNLITYKEGINYQSAAQNWEDKIEAGGTGTSYGIELLVQKKSGRTTGWLAYTYSRSMRQFENINEGKNYPFKYDRTHDLSIVLNQKISKNINISGTWVFGTGYPYTLPVGKYTSINQNDSFLSSNTNLSYDAGGIYIWEDRNSRRMRNFHHLDLAANFSKQKKRGTRTWTISIYNVYNRQNPYYYFMRYEKQEWKLYQQSLFPIIPSISYSYKF